MKLKLVGGDSAGVVTAYYVSGNQELIRTNHKSIFFILCYIKKIGFFLFLFFIIADVYRKCSRARKR